jgi:hypothetical protein
MISIYLEMKLTEIQNDQTTNSNDLILERDSLYQENQLFKNAIDGWSKQYEEIRLLNEQLAKSFFFSSCILSIQIYFLLDT